MNTEKAMTSLITFYNDGFAKQVKDAATDKGVSVGILAKQALAKFLYIELPKDEEVIYRPAVGKYSHIIGTNKTREKNLKNLTQYILDHWSEMPEDIKAQVIANQDTNPSS